MTTTNKQMETNTFWHIANEYRNFPTEDSKIETINMTQQFFKEIDKMLTENELLNMNINAPPGSGKSVTAMAIAAPLQQKHYNKTFGLKDIDRDQYEFIHKMLHKDMWHTIRVIDEWSELEATGANSTTLQAVLNQFSDVYAQRNVHKISCSPKDITDKNALIFLEVIASDKKNAINRCKLYYRMTTVNMEYNQLLGYVDISVKEIINTNWYKTYRKRKFERMKLLLKHGIKQARILDYARPLKEVYEQLKRLAQFGIVDRDVVSSLVRNSAEKHKTIQSLVGENDAVTEIMGMLKLLKSYWTIQAKQDRIREKAQKTGNMVLSIRADELEQTKKDLQTAITTKKERLDLYETLRTKYNEE